MEIPTSPASTSGVETSSSAARSPLSLPATPSEQSAKEVTSTLRRLEEEFFHLVIFIEDTLQKQ